MLDAVIGDVLDFSKIEAQQLKIDPAPFNLPTFLSEICLATNQCALQNKIELVCSISRDVPKVIVGDEQRLRQVLTNVIKNAVNNFLCAELKVSVGIDDSDQSMLLFEVKGTVQLMSDRISSVDEDPLWDDDQTPIISAANPDLGINLARKQMLLMGGEFGSEPKEDSPVFWLRLPIIANEFEANPAFRFSSLRGKKAFVFESSKSSKSSREVIINCCEEAGMIVESVDEVSALGDAISEPRERHDIDIILVADSPGGRNIERITDICLAVLGQDLPLIILAYRRNRLDLDRYESAALIRKPFITDLLLDAMEMVLASDSRHGDNQSPSKSVVEESYF